MMDNQIPTQESAPSSQPPSAVVRGAVVSTDAAAEPIAIVQPSAVRTTATNTAENSPPSSPATSRDSSDIGDTTVTLEFDFGTYVGEVDPTNGLRSGHGTLTYTSGNVYEGEWRDGAANGVGEKRYTNGDVYRGGWVNGKRSGRGGYLYAQGHYFEGMYEDDEPNGYGVLKTVGGDRYAGHWKQGKKDGKGRETLQGGQVFVGHWKDGHKQGRGKLYLPGAKGFIFGIWNNDHFFRELTQEEMGVDGEMDVVDEFGLPTDRSDRASAAAAREAPGQRNTESAGLLPPSLGGGLTDAFLSGVAAIENRLEAFGRALERVTTGTEGPQGNAAPLADPADAHGQPATLPQQDGGADELSHATQPEDAHPAAGHGNEGEQDESVPATAEPPASPIGGVDAFAKPDLQAQPPLAAEPQ